MINIQKMMQQAQLVQNKLAEMQEKFKDIYVEGEAGGGLVKVNMSCAGVINTLDIDQSLVEGGDKEMLEDMVTAAINSVSEAKDARIEEETKKIMGDAGLPAGAKLPF